jgi:hypothetical protein
MKSSRPVISLHDVAEDLGLHSGEEFRCDCSAYGMPVRPQVSTREPLDRLSQK